MPFLSIVYPFLISIPFLTLTLIRNLPATFPHLPNASPSDSHSDTTRCKPESVDLSECGLVEFGARSLINRMLNLEASIYTWDQEHEERPSSVVLLRRPPVGRPGGYPVGGDGRVRLWIKGDTTRCVRTNNVTIRVKRQRVRLPRGTVERIEGGHAQHRHLRLSRRTVERSRAGPSCRRWTAGFLRSPWPG